MTVLGMVEDSVHQLAAETHGERIQRIANAWLAYQGDSPRAIPVAVDGTDDNVRLNFAETIVVKGATFLMGPTGLGFQVEQDVDGSALARFEQEWPPERRAIALHQLAVNGGIAGHAVLRLKRNPTRVIVVDPSTFDAVWDEEDIENVLRYTITWTAIDPNTGEAMVRRQRFEPMGGIWVIFDERSTSDGDQWTVIGEERHPYPWPPIFHCQHLPAPNEFWGRSALEPHVLDLIRAVEVLASGMRKIVRHFGHPVPYVIGETAKNLSSVNVALGQLLAVPNKDAKIGQLEMTSELSAIITLYRELRQALHEITRIPEVATGKLENAGALSGVALSILYGPAIELGSELRLSYGPMLANLAARILELGGQRNRIVTPQWPNITPEDRQAGVERDEAELRMRVVSRQTICEARGYDWQEEERRMAAEAEAAAQAMVDAFNAGQGGGGVGGGGAPPPTGGDER